MKKKIFILILLMTSSALAMEKDNEDDCKPYDKADGQFYKLEKYQKYVPNDILTKYILNLLKQVDPEDWYDRGIPGAELKKILLGKAKRIVDGIEYDMTEGMKNGSFGCIDKSGYQAEFTLLEEYRPLTGFQTPSIQKFSSRLWSNRAMDLEKAFDLPNLEKCDHTCVFDDFTECCMSSDNPLVYSCDTKSLRYDDFVKELDEKETL